MVGAASDLIGRSREIALLAGLLSGDLRALVVEGDAGVGKTALLDDLDQRARGEGWSVARCQCVEAEQDFPYSTLNQILGPFTHDVPLLPDHQREAIDVVLGRATGEAPAMMALGTAVLTLLGLAGAGPPLAVLVDDAHWMDSASGRVFMFAARRLRGATASIALAVRTGEPTDLDTSGIEHLRLSPLDPASAVELLDGRIEGRGAHVAAFVNQATTGPVVLVGHSYGGSVITNAATRTPRVKALVYIDAYALGRARASSN